MKKFLGRYMKVKHPTLKKPAYLEFPNVIGGPDGVGIGGPYFITGYAIDKFGVPKVLKGGGVVYKLQLGDGVNLIPQKMNRKQRRLEDEKS